MTVNPVFHARSKHIELDYHFVRERVALGLLITQHISTHEQIADIFTKPMSKGVLAYFKDKLCLRLRPSLREDVNGNKTDAHGNNSTAAVSQQCGNQRGNESALMETNQVNIQRNRETFLPLKHSYFSPNFRFLDNPKSETLATHFSSSKIFVVFTSR